jgi:ABC-type transport system involved in cytochrome c biogenesis permease subunit
VAVLHEGRVKPFDTYARSMLLQFSGKTTYNRRPAYEWMAKLLFAPASTVKDKVFLINSPEIPMALGIEPEKQRRYDFAQLNPGIDKLVELAKIADQIAEKKRSVVEQEILRVYHNVVLYTRFSYVFTYAFPHPDFQVRDPELIELLDLPKDQKGQFSFLDIAIKADALREATKGLEMGTPQMWSEKEKVLFHLLGNLYHWANSYYELPFPVLPSVEAGNEMWLSPWDAINIEFYDPNIRNEVAWLRDMTVHYWNGDQLAFDLSTRAFQNSIAERVVGHEKRNVSTIPLELFYNKAQFFLWSKLLYGLAFLVFLFSLMLPGFKGRKAALGLILTGFMIHTVALIIRIVLMERPPVSNLYETFVFVGFIAVLLGLIIEFVNKRGLGVVVASVCGLVFLMIAAKFSAEGDTLKMLVAVLNSNFWLGTHVLSITTGYAGCCVAGIVGHLYIIQRIVKPNEKNLLETTYRNLIGTLAFGLMMAFLGTMLGGIWADQSWGRFWGWDPKENGALLIVLWTAIIFHARVAGWIGPLGMAVGSVLGIIVVMWAWFGVNLLSIGLHSYGFTSGVAAGLAVYVVSEIVFLMAAGFLLRKKP